MVLDPKDPKEPGAPSVPNNLSAYTALMVENKAALVDNAAAYMNKRNFRTTAGGSPLSKILSNATFIAAHPSRSKSGFNVENMKYFVVHSFDQPVGTVPTATPYKVYSWTVPGIVATFSTPIDKAVAHFIIGLDGELIQSVDLMDTAYHCGTKEGASVYNTNSVGVELAGPLGQPFTDKQYLVLASLIRTLNVLSNNFLGNVNAANFATFARTRILGHSQINLAKKDPGALFDYARLISLIPKASDNSGTPYKPLENASETVSNNLTTVVVAASEAKTSGEKAQCAALIQSAVASYRQTSILNPERARLDAWASTASLKMATLQGSALGNTLKLMDSQNVESLALNFAQFSPRLNSSTGKWE
jgi:N-acetyl-anhydromuramyl-L-alanine amidase AmpD